MISADRATMAFHQERRPSTVSIDVKPIRSATQIGSKLPANTTRLRDKIDINKINSAMAACCTAFSFSSSCSDSWRITCTALLAVLMALPDIGIISNFQKRRRDVVIDRNAAPAV